jgi:hypothetical protein
VRQQAGIHAQRINVLFDELLHGHPSIRRICVSDRTYAAGGHRSICSA